MQHINNIIIKIQSEKASGFVETLIAILVAGVGCAALLGLSASIIRHVKNNEIRDAMTQASVEGLENVRNLALTSYDNVPSLPIGGAVYCLTSRDGTDHGCGEYDPDINPHYFVQIQDSNSRCSRGGDMCERVALDAHTDDFFYREIQMKPLLSATEVTVLVGRFICPGDLNQSDPDERCSTSMKGFIYSTGSLLAPSADSLISQIPILMGVSYYSISY